MAERKISFKSVGELRENIKKREQLETPKIPIGISTPISLGKRELFAMNTSLEDQIHDNFRNLLLTDRGSRLGRENFGCSLSELTLEFGRDDFDAEIGRRVKFAVSKFMPFIELIDFSTEIDYFDNKETARILLTITYNIPTLSVLNKKIGVQFFIAG